MSVYVLFQAGIQEDLISPQLQEAVEQSPDNFHGVDFCIPVGPIFNFVSGILAIYTYQKKGEK